MIYSYSEGDFSLWTDALRKFSKKDITLFHTPEYLLSWKRFEKGTPICLHFEMEEYHILYPFFLKPIVPNRGQKIFFDVTSAYGYGGFASNSKDIPEDVLALCNEEIDSWMKKEKVIAEFIREYPNTSLCRYGEKIKVRNNLFFEYGKDRNAFSKLIKKRAIRDARLSSKKGSLAIYDWDLATLNNFIEMYHEFCKEKGLEDSHMFSREYFADVKEMLGNQAFIINIYYKDIILAASLNFVFNGMIIYHLSASMYEYRNFLPNDLMLYTLLQTGADLLCTSVFLGGGISNDDNDSLYRFKEKYATSSSDVYIVKKVVNPNAYNDLCQDWENNNPDLKEKYRNYFLKYRV